MTPPLSPSDLAEARELCERAPANFVEMTGRSFGYLTVVSRAQPGSRDGQARWVCRCACGAQTVVSGGNLRSGGIKSCGCLIGELNRKQKTTHGHSPKRKRSAEYTAWRGMYARCYNPKHKSFSDYGGRGITICQQWRESFEAFFADVGLRPDPKRSLDRIDPDGNYEPGNVRWATWSEQRMNQRRSPALAKPGEQP